MKAAVLALIVLTVSATAGCGSTDSTVTETAAAGAGISPAAVPDTTARTTDHPTAAPSGTIEACRTGGTVVTLGPAEGAAGTVYRPLLFTNNGGRPCVLHGFPAVSYVAADQNTQLGPAAETEGEKGGPVTLAPKAVASATLALVNVRNFDPALCRPTPVPGLRVYLPGDIAAEFVALSGTACAGKPPGPQLRVRTIQRGPGQG